MKALSCFAAAAAVVALVILPSGINAETFYWRAAAGTFADYGGSENWDVGTDGGGNALNLVPGENDEIFGARNASWNLGIVYDSFCKLLS